MSMLLGWPKYEDVFHNRPDLAGHHVLLAEDSDINREIAVELLKMMDIIVDNAREGQSVP